MPRFARLAFRICAAVVSLALSLPPVHLERSPTPGARGFVEDSGPEHAAPALSCDLAEFLPDARLADVEERDGRDATGPMSPAARVSSRRARVARRLSKPRRVAQRPRSRRCRWGRASTSRGDPDSEDATLEFSPPACPRRMQSHPPGMSFRSSPPHRRSPQLRCPSP